ncbi:MAG: hypothetical protein ACTSUE_17280 [Promethearchaeota archaeon]
MPITRRQERFIDAPHPCNFPVKISCIDAITPIWTYKSTGEYIFDNILQN